MQKTLTTLVVVEIVVGGLLAVLLVAERGEPDAAAPVAPVAASDGAPAGGSPSGPARGTNDANGTNGPNGARDAAAADARSAAPPGAAKFDPADPLGVVLTGTVRWRDGRPVVRGSIDAARGDVHRAVTAELDGGYALTGLSPGEWQLHFDAPEAAPATLAFAATDDAVQVLDAVLDRAFMLRVLARTPDGGDALAALRAALGPKASPTVVARRDRLPDAFAPSEDGPGFPGDGKWIAAPAQRDGLLGTLALPAPPPVHAALVLQHVVLAQQPLHEGQREVVFTVDPAAVGALVCSLRVRVLDDATGTPLAKARVTVADPGGRGKVVDADGRAAFDGLLPGALRCQVTAPDRETFDAVVRPRRGEVLDLGDVRLAAAVRLRGRVVDEHGGAAQAKLAWVDLKWRTSPAPFGDSRTSRCEPDGTFALWACGPGPVAVTATTSDGRIACGVFDNPPSAPVELRLARSCRLVLEHPGDPARGFVVSVLDGARRPVGAWEAWPRRGGRQVVLPPGTWAYEVHDERQQLVQSGSVELGAVPATIVIR